MSTPPGRGVAPPERPVPAPLAINGTWYSRQRLTIRRTSSVLAGSTTADGTPL